LESSNAVIDFINDNIAENCYVDLNCGFNYNNFFEITKVFIYLFIYFIKNLPSWCNFTQNLFAVLPGVSGINMPDFYWKGKNSL